MIGSLSGTLLHVGETKILLDVSGVGYEVVVSPSTALLLKSKVGEAIERLSIYTHFQEYALKLFGFRDIATKHFFELLLGVSGIGPQIALAITDNISPEGFYRRVSVGEVGDLTQIKGIGKKTAERILLELKDKIPVVVGDAAFAQVKGGALSRAPIEDDALSALLALGYKRPEAEAALRQLPQELSGVEVRLKAALAALGRRAIGR